MRSPGTAKELERRRRRAVQRVEEGFAQVAVAAFLGVTPRTVNGWVAAHGAGGMLARAPKRTPGRPRKLTPRQERAVLGWVAKSPTAFGYPDELWTSRRVATLIERRLKVRMNANYLVAWLPSANRAHRNRPSGRWSATSPRSSVGSMKTGHGCKKSPRRAGSPRLHRRERLLPKPPGQAHLGAPGTNPRARPLRPAPG